MTVRLSRAAEEDLQEIFYYSIVEHGIVQAERYKGHLEKAFQTLSENPRIARLRSEITPSVCVYPVKKHVIVYTTAEEDQSVYVLRVRHQRENWTEQPL